MSSYRDFLHGLHAYPGMRYPVTVYIEQDGRVWIQEGNHRLRAGHRAGIPILVEIKYFGNSQRQGLIFPVP